MRIDIYLVNSACCDSRTKAQRIIDEGRVFVNDKAVLKPSFDVSESDNIIVLPSDAFEYVGRGGNKLEKAIREFNIDVKNKVCLDIGASTGGFTECLLNYGAKIVYAVDSGTGQLAEKLLFDDRVTSIEGFNARGLTRADIDGQSPQIVVMDVSFISQKLLYPAVLSVAEKGADVITLIKPQFEAGKQNLTKKGIVKDEKVRQKVVKDIIDYARSMNFQYISHVDSPILGGDGNKEFLMHLKVK